MNLLTVGQDDLTLMAQFGRLGATPVTSYSWVSSVPAAATVTPVGDGLTATVHAVGAGTTTITLTAGGLSATWTVKVVAAPAASLRILAMSPTGQKYPNDPGSGGGQEINPNPN